MRLASTQIARKPERLEAPIKNRSQVIGLDGHGQVGELAVVYAAGAVVARERGDTPIPARLPGVPVVPRPRALGSAEGPLAGWRWRGLPEAVDRLVVRPPRRHRLIGDHGDQDDPSDAEPLAPWRRGGFGQDVHPVARLPSLTPLLQARGVDRAPGAGPRRAAGDAFAWRMAASAGRRPAAPARTRPGRWGRTPRKKSTKRLGASPEKVS